VHSAQALSERVNRLAEPNRNTGAPDGLPMWPFASPIVAF